MTIDYEKYLQTAVQKGNQMTSKRSNEVVGRIDTEGLFHAFRRMRKGFSLLF